MIKPVERALSKIGNAHTYQKLFVVYLFFVSGFVNYLLMGPTLIYMNPLFQCSFTEDLVDQSIACDRLNECSIVNDFTIVSRNGLYCDGQVSRNLIQSISAIGSVIGLFAINFLSDYKGKKVSLILALSLAIVAMGLTMVGGFTGSVAVLTIAQFISGMSGYSIVILSFVYPSQLCQGIFRQKTIIIMTYAWSLTSCLLGLLFYLQVYWYNYILLFVIFPMIGILLITFFFVVEGPNFLYTHKQQKQCLKVLQTIALINNKMSQFQQVKQDFKVESNQQQKDTQDPITALKTILKDNYYRKAIIIFILLDTGSTLYYMGTSFALDLIGYDYGANMIATGVLELLSLMVLQFNIDRIPKKQGIIVLYIIITVLGVLFFIRPIVDSQIASFVIIGVIRFFYTMSYQLGLMLITQNFPLPVQAICAGIIEAISQIGNFLGPIIITISIDMKIYPVIILTFVEVFTCLIPIYFYADKKPQDLKQSLIQVDQEVRQSVQQ